MLHFHRTLPINNLTRGPRFGFSHTCFFPMESHLGFFLSNFVFTFKIDDTFSTGTGLERAGIDGPVR